MPLTQNKTTGILRAKQQNCALYSYALSAALSRSPALTLFGAALALFGRALRLLMSWVFLILSWIMAKLLIF